MKMDSYFNLNRFVQFIKIEILLNLKKVILYISSITVILLLVSILWLSMGESVENFHPIFYSGFLFLFGIYFGSIGFTNWKLKDRAYFYLGLPVSTFEKFLSVLLFTCFGFIIFSLIYYYFLSILINLISKRFFHILIAEFLPFSNIYFVIIMFFVLLQSFFLLGSIWFNKLSFFKMILGLSLMLLLSGMILFVLVRIIFFDFFSGLMFLNSDLPNFHLSSFVGFATLFCWPFLKILLFVIFPPLIWLITFLKLKEKEAVNGI